MMSTELLPQLYRTEYSKLTALLCRRFGLKYIETAEDIASETFLKASEIWTRDGLPENPTAWLYTAAKNRTKDYLKRTSIWETKVKDKITPDDLEEDTDFELTPEIISDSQLALIFAVCDPAISVQSQIGLALQVLGGFSLEEIADAFLTRKETIKKRLFRAKANLRKSNFYIHNLTEETITQRLNSVLKTLYLLFNEGYYSKSSDVVIRKDLCAHALRLVLILTENSLTDLSETNALLALMCYQSSRLEARIDSAGDSILFDEQNKDLWDKELIDRGNYFLVNACKNETISKYHLEAGIAYRHTTTDENKWIHILDLYNQLILIEYSPVTALNRTFAYAKVYGNEKAIIEAEKIKLENNNYYYSLLGYLYSSINTDKAIEHYETAVKLTKSASERKTLRKEIQRLINREEEKSGI